MPQAPKSRRRLLIVGMGQRGAGMWGKELIERWGDVVELVGLVDQNPLRLARARDFVGARVPTFVDLDAALEASEPDTVVVATPDYTHDEVIVRALEAGADVISEKPLATTADKARRILAAEARTGHRVDVAFNYRFSPTAARIKSLIREGAIGRILSVDFHWYLDTRHGADYFRRWHAYVGKSGSLFVHKATHHFDLLNWHLEGAPQFVFAFGDLRVYGRNGAFRGARCKTCDHARDCPFHFNLAADAYLSDFYEEPSKADGYVRDACVFREDIDIFDTMTAAIRYETGAQVSYSLNAAMPIEGYRLAFNGEKGRIEIRQYERQAWPEPPSDMILLARNFGAAERIFVAHQSGGHFGGDDALRDALFRSDAPDPLGRRADARAGALAMLCGVAAELSARESRLVAIDSLGLGL